MKKILLSAALVFFLGFNGYSQIKSEFELVRAVFGTEKTNYVKNQLSLNDSEEMVFWPIYEDYEIARAKFSGKRWEILQKYASKYSSLSRSEANNYISDLLRYQKKEWKLKRKYFNMMSNKLSPVVASKFIQLEEFINYRIKYTILKDVPFVEE